MKIFINETMILYVTLGFLNNCLRKNNQLERINLQCSMYAYRLTVGDYVYVKMASKVAGKVAFRYLLGTCVPSSKQNAAKVRIPEYKFDNYINMVSTREYIQLCMIYLDNLMVRLCVLLTVFQRT